MAGLMAGGVLELGMVAGVGLSPPPIETTEAEEVR